MAGNDLTNAGFLDGTVGWAALSGGISVDTTARGGQGRAVLLTSTGAASVPIAVTAGQQIEVAALFGDLGGAAKMEIVIAGGANPRITIPILRASAGPARAGAPETLNQGYAVVTAPISGDARMVVTGLTETWLSKPYLDVAPVTRKAYVWDPGVTTHPDLSRYRRWPAHLPPILLEGYSPQNTPIREGWEPDGKREITTRIAGRAAVKMSGRLRVTRAEFSDLEAFCRASEDPFLFVRPETAELCLATWQKDGAPLPEPTGIGDLYASIGLLLSVI